MMGNCGFAETGSSFQIILRGRFVNRPYAGCGADSPGNVVMVGASCRVVEDADLHDFDPVTFQHENLETFEKTVRAALA